MRMVDKTKRKERRELGHTALSAAHMVIYPDKPGGDDMVKVRLQGTKEDMEWLEKQMENLPNVKITESSETFRNKGTNKYYRKYIEIEKTNQEYFLTQSGEEYLLKNPIEKWPVENKFNLDINVEYLKESKTPSSLTKAMRLIAKYLLEGQPLKGCSLESALYEDIKNCKNLALEIEKDVFNGKRNSLEVIFNKYLGLGLTKALIGLVLLEILAKNIDKNKLNITYPLLKKYSGLELMMMAINLKNYDDSACMIFDTDNQPVYMGGSGVSCLPLVTYTHIFDKMKKGKLKKVLIVPTGAIFSPTRSFQKDSIPSIAHAISLEVSE